jgi:peptidoglycan/LPS O-acetylase OafA/YrhL
MTGQPTGSIARPDAGHMRHADFPVLHILRALAAICIFAGHWTEPFVTDAFPQGQLAIDMFFMIEGFLAAQLLSFEWNGNGPGALALARLRHVYPIYLASLLAGFAAVGGYVLAGANGWTPALWTRALVAGVALLPIQTTIVHGSVYPLNPPSWAIVLELIGFGALLLACRRSPRLGAFFLWGIGAVVLLGFVVLWHDPNMGWRSERYWGGWPRMAFGFFGGALLFALHSRWRDAPRLSWLIAPLICAGFVAMQFLRIRFIAWPLVGIVTPLLVLMAARIVPPAWLEHLGTWTGRRALAIYLFGYPIMIGWRIAGAGFHMSPAFLGSAAGFAMVLATILIAAELWWRAGVYAARTSAPRSSIAPATSTM